MTKEWRPKRWKRLAGWYLAIMGGLMLASNVLGVLAALMPPVPEDWFYVVRSRLGGWSLIPLLLLGWGIFWIRDNKPQSSN